MDNDKKQLTTIDDIIFHKSVLHSEFNKCRTVYRELCKKIDCCNNILTKGNCLSNKYSLYALSMVVNHLNEYASILDDYFCSIGDCIIDLNNVIDEIKKQGGVQL